MQWKSTKARLVYTALLRNGWSLLRRSGAHKVLSKPGHAAFSFAFHDREEIGPRMLARIARVTGLCREQL